METKLYFFSFVQPKGGTVLLMKARSALQFPWQWNILSLECTSKAYMWNKTLSLIVTTVYILFNVNITSYLHVNDMLLYIFAVFLSKIQLVTTCYHYLIL